MSTQTARRTAYAALAVTVLTAGWMFWRNSQLLLWGYAPLLLYFSAFIGYFLLRNYPRDGEPKVDRWYAPAAGLLLGTGFVGDIDIFFNLFLGFVPLFELLRRLQQRNAGYVEVFRHGFTAFVLFNLLTTYWVTNTGFGAGFFAMLANSVLMCLPWLFAYWTSKYSPSLVTPAFIAAWISFEYGHYHWELNWPWLTLGNGFADVPEIIQWYEVTGVLGGSLWVLLANWAYHHSFFRYATAPARSPRTQSGAAPKSPPPPPPRKGGEYLRRLLTFVLIIALPMAGSIYRYNTYEPPAGETITVAAIQPNFEPHFEKFADRRQAAPLDTFLRLSREALEKVKVDYLIYPETSFRGVEERSPLTNPALRTLNAELGDSGAKYLVTGISAYNTFAPGETPTKAVRYSGNVAYEGLNATIQIELGTDNYQTYRKGVFVPGAESFPFRDYLPFMKPLVASVGGTVAGLGTQERRTPMVGGKAKIAPVICYESVFGEYFTDYIREGAQAIFVVTNDGWWDNTAGHMQHLYYSSIRAIETRRDVVRSANMGACAYINQYGDIVNRTRYGQEGYLFAEMKLNDALTPYVRYGDWVSKLALAGLLLFFGSNLFLALRTNKG